VKRRLVLVAHGSRDPAWRRPVEQLAERLRAASPSGPEGVVVAYLEHCEPSLPDVLDATARAGFSEISLLPLFIASGAHVRKDLPAAAETTRRAHPSVTVEILPALGEHPEVVAALERVASALLQ
jgi:sirohydrochlorin cobaltochelatase